MPLARGVRRFSLVFAIVLIAGCATQKPAFGTFDANTPHWQGRLALKVESTPVQALSANFDLQGNAQTGRLSFTSPLGSTLAQLQWGPGTAELLTGGSPQRFDSLDALTRHATGTELPVAALFSWLQGQPAEAPGWEADLSALPEGRLVARRLAPDIPAELKIILDQ